MKEQLEHKAVEGKRFKFSNTGLVDLVGKDLVQEVGFDKPRSIAYKDLNTDNPRSFRYFVHEADGYVIVLAEEQKRNHRKWYLGSFTSKPQQDCTAEEVFDFIDRVQAVSSEENMIEEGKIKGILEFIALSMSNQ